LLPICSVVQQAWAAMTAPQVQTIRDRLPAGSRPRWCDLADSSQECSKDVPAAPTVDDSYDKPATGLGENSKDGLNSRLKLAAVIEKGPINFSFLFDDAGNSGGTAGATTSSASTSPPLNPSAPAFVPSSSDTGKGPQPSSPSMPPPAVPQASTKARRIRGKRALSIVQDPPVKKARDEDGAAAGEAAAASQPQQRTLPFLEPPPASEEEWQHRIAKRVKVVGTIKETPEYTLYTSVRAPADRHESEPRTPTAEDRNLSKRRWEYEIQQWRSGLKQWAAKHSGDADMQTDEATCDASAALDEASE
jgi:hypothetical protein